MDKVAVGLADAVDALRAELTEAIEKGKERSIQFALEPIELEIQVAVEKEANGRIGWSVLGLGGSYESANTQTLTLRMTPVWKADDGTLTRDIRISGAGATGDRFGPHS